MTLGLKKALADLRSHPGKSGLTWLAMLVGVALVMAVFGARGVLQREIAASYAASAPAGVVIWTDAVDDALRARLSTVPNVRAVDGRRLIRARAEVAPGDWRSLLIYGVRDFDDQNVSRTHRVSGAWPPPVGTLVIEQSALPVLNTDVNATLHVRMPGESRPRQVTVSGITHDPARAPGWQDNVGYAYASPATLAGLGLGAVLNEVHLAVDGDRAAAERVAAEATSAMQALGHPVRRVEVPPRQHPHADHMRAMLMLLQVLAVLAVLLAGVLSTTLIASMLARQVRQIGVMKAAGGQPWPIARIYLATVGLLSTTATAGGVVLGLALAQQCVTMASAQLNLFAVANAVPGVSIGVVTAIGVLLPLLITAIPIRRAVQMTARAAIRDARAPNQALRGQWARRGSVGTRVAVRTALQKRGRVALTLFGFAVGGALLMTAANAHRALTGAVDATLAARADAIEVRLLGGAPRAEFDDALRAIDGVVEAAIWGATLATYARPDAAPSTALKPVVGGRHGLLAPPNGRRPGGAVIVAGRWLAAASESELVVNRQMLALEPHLQVGVRTTVSLGGRVQAVTVVGHLEEIAPASAYITPAGMQALLGRANWAGGARLVLAPGADIAHVAHQLELVISAHGWMPVYLMTTPQLRAAMVDHFMILLMVLLIIAGSACLIGTLALGTTMSISVLERRREIGVMKAMGAQAAVIRRLILLEGGVTALLSIPVAVAVSVPLTHGVLWVVGQHGLHVTLPMRISAFAIGGWCILAAAATLLACLGPAAHAIRQPVCALIAHE